MAGGKILTYANETPEVGGRTDYIRENSDIKRLRVRERCQTGDDESSFTLSQKFPAHSRLIGAQVKYASALGVDGTNGTNGTADHVALVKTAPTSLTTNVTTQGIIFGSTTTSSNTLALELNQVNADEWINTSSSAQDLYLVPASSGSTKFDVATDGYLYDGSTNVDVDLVFEQVRELPDA